MLPEHEYDYPASGTDDDGFPRLDQLPPMPPVPISDDRSELDVYSYLGISYYADEKHLHRAERMYAEHMDAVHDNEIDGCDPPAPFCGCSTCYDRATIGFWTAYVIQAIRAGLISIEQPPDPAQETLF